MGYGTGPGGEASEAETALLDDDGDDGDGGWFSDDDEDTFKPEDLEPPGEKLGFGAGGLTCLLAVLTAWVGALTVYKDVDSRVLSVEVANSGTVMGVAAVAALALGVIAGFVYRATADDVHDGYRQNLTAAIFLGPIVASVGGWRCTCSRRWCWTS